jgi:hypothetical protein
MILNADEGKPALVCDPHELAAAVERARVRDDRDPNLYWS